MIYVIGDTHGDIDLHVAEDLYATYHVKRDPEVRKTDKLIVAGDFGLLWNSVDGDREKRIIDFWLTRYSEVLWIDGNHENFDRIKELPTEERYGSDVGVVTPGIYHLRRGRVYTIKGLKFFTFGGGFSIDKVRRVEGVSWWKEEIPSFMESKRGLDELETHDNKVDYMITHTAPLSVFHTMCSFADFKCKVNNGDRSLMEYLDHVASTVEFKQWFFGHYHIDVVMEEGKYRCLYEQVNFISEDNELELASNH